MATKGVKFKITTKEKYAALKSSNKLDENSLYFIKDEGVFYKGTTLYSDRLADLKFLANPENNHYFVNLSMYSGKQFSFETVAYALILVNMRDKEEQKP